MPDTATISRIAKSLGVDVAVLLSAAESPDESPNVLLVDDESIILDGSLPVLREALRGQRSSASQFMRFFKHFTVMEQYNQAFFIPASNEPSHACVCFPRDAYGMANAARGAKHPADACYAPTVTK